MNEKIILFGGRGTVGKALRKLLLSEGYEFISPSRRECDLCNLNEVDNLFHTYQPKYTINLTGEKTNITTNDKTPALIYSNTVQAGLNLFYCCQLYGVKKLLQVVSSCAYPYDKTPLREEDFDKGQVHPSIESHGNAKRQLYYLAKYYKKQYGLNTITLCFNNIYGGRNPKEILKVCDSLIVKMIEGKKYNHDSIELMGTGKACREFIYHKDAAEGVLKAFNTLDEIDLLNIGNGVDISIKELAIIIKYLVGYEGKITFNQNQNHDGQQSKLLEVDKMKKLLNRWCPPTELSKGIRESVDWYSERLAASV